MEALCFSLPWGEQRRICADGTAWYLSTSGSGLREISPAVAREIADEAVEGHCLITAINLELLATLY